jgi:hypothetical protein
MYLRGQRHARALCVFFATILPLGVAHARAGRPVDYGRSTSDTTLDSSCVNAVHAAEARYALPSGLLLAIAQVESGRVDPASHRLEPWPWTVQAENKSLYFDSKIEAIQWVRAAQARGLASIDTGCMQVNLFFHPHAFQSVDEAFDPSHNADYAARFLIALHASTGDWQQAAGLYHSQTQALAIPYRERVERVLNGGPLNRLPAAPPQPPSPLSLLRVAWGATLSRDKPAPAHPALNDWSVLLHPPPHSAARRLLRHGRAEMLTDAR